MTLAASRPARKPEKQAISQTFRKTREEGDHLVFLPRIDAERMGLAARPVDRGGQGFQLIGMAANDDSRITPARKALGYGSAQGVAGPDHDDGLVPHNRH
jgi:hypothetical protein